MKKTFNKDLLLQLFSQFLVSGLSFLTAPIFTRLLSPADYGQLSTYSSWVTFLGIFVGLQTYGSVSLAKNKYEQKQFNEYLSSILSISVLSFLILLPFFLIFKNQIATLLGFPSFLIPVMLVQSFFSFCISFYSSVLIRTKKVEKNTVISLSQAVLTVILSIIFVLYLQKQKYLGKIIATNIIYILFGLCFLIKIYKSGKTTFNKEYWKFCLSYTSPLIMHALGAVILNQSDRVMIKSMVSESEAGIYGVVYTLALVISIVKDSFNKIWVPYYYDYKKEGNKEAILQKSKKNLFIFTLITIFFIFLSPFAFKIMAPKEYWSGIKWVPLIAVAYYFNYIYTFPANYEFYTAKTKIIGVGTTVTAVINLILNWFLIPVYGGFGAAVATLISYVFLFVLHQVNVMYVVKGKDYEFGWKFFVWGIIAVGVSMLFVMLFV